ncbi:hypothetical protein F3Y22_tig00110745pilonHSYRG00115 [Hibiscus syriacus]|uniref:Choline transporter-like protein n=1 Tax=Hibiscus syriacus TaxID=106335 RepID=A0A6A2ZT58_HIBSY|nr:hypothetical protein F3Y22_tig00110745pilonHSYRG00115 [Hibiscus syriacus]
MGSTEEETTSTSKPIPLYDAALPTEPLLFKPTTSSTYSSPPIEEPPQPDPSESDPTQFIHISFNYGPRPFKDLPFLFLFLLSVLCTFSFGIFSIFHRNDSYSNVSTFTYDSNSTSCVQGTSFSSKSVWVFESSVFLLSSSSLWTYVAWTFVITLVLSVPICFLLLLLLKHYTKQIVYVLLPFFVIVPTFFDVYWFVACTLSSSCSDTFPLVYRILVLVFVLLGVGVIVWIVAANWHRIEWTVRIIGVASDSLSRNLGLFLVIPLLTAGLLVYYAPIVVFLVFSTFNGKIVAKESNGEYTCVWKQDSWVPAYFTLAILTMLWSLKTMVEAQVYVISGTIAQWYFSKDEEKPHRSIRRSLSAREEDVTGIVNIVLRCCVNALMYAIEFLNKFTINFASITGEAYCTSARMTYELLRLYAIVVCAIVKGVSDLGDNTYNALLEGIAQVQHFDCKWVSVTFRKNVPPREQAKWKRNSQAILIVWSKIAGKYEYNVTTANFMVETLKCALSLAALARIWKSEGVTDDNRLSTTLDELSYFHLYIFLFVRNVVLKPFSGCY